MATIGAAVSRGGLRRQQDHALGREARGDGLPGRQALGRADPEPGPGSQREHDFILAPQVFDDLDLADPGRQRMFAWVWMGVTVAVVFVGLQRLKRARRPRPD